MKQCARCKDIKKDEEFNWRWQEKGVRQSICRDCQKIVRRDFYERHVESEKARTFEISKRTKEEAEKFVYEYLSNSVCVDCGEYDFAVLSFDHVRGKKKMSVQVNHK